MNQKQKTELIRKALVARFKEVEAALELRRQSFAAKALTAFTGPAPSLDKDWVPHSAAVTLHSATGFEAHNRYWQDAILEPLLNRDVRMINSLPVNLRVRNGAAIEVTDSKLITEVEKLVKDIKTYIVEREAVRTALTALLATVRTYNQLTVAWPEGEAIYAFLKPVAKTRELVDPNVLKLLNKELIK